MRSHHVICCTANVWALVIGWMQTITYALTFVAFSVYYYTYNLSSIFISSQGNSSAIADTLDFDGDEIASSTEVNYDYFNLWNLILSVSELGVFVSLIGLITGIFLILGVIQKSQWKLKVWIAIELIFMALSVIWLPIEAANGSFKGQITDIFAMLGTVFCVWIVNVHRKEISNESAARTTNYYKNCETFESV